MVGRLIICWRLDLDIDVAVAAADDDYDRMTSWHRLLHAPTFWQGKLVASSKCLRAVTQLRHWECWVARLVLWVVNCHSIERRSAALPTNLCHADMTVVWRHHRGRCKRRQRWSRVLATSRVDRWRDWQQQRPIGTRRQLVLTRCAFRFHLTAADRPRVTDTRHTCFTLHSALDLWNFFSRGRKVRTGLERQEFLGNLAICLKVGIYPAVVNPFKPSGVKWLHFKVFRAILV